MKRTTLTVLALIGIAVPAAAEWTAAGWYQIGTTQESTLIWDGPFATQAECEGALPDNDEVTIYRCELLDNRPAWDVGPVDPG